MNMPRYNVFVKGMLAEPQAEPDENGPFYLVADVDFEIARYQSDLTEMERAIGELLAEASASKTNSR